MPALDPPDLSMKNADPNEAAGADAAADASPAAPPEEAISFSDVTLAAEEMKVPKIPPAARPASRPPPPLPARKSEKPPAKPAAVSAPPRPRPPPRPVEPVVEAEVAPPLPEPVKAPATLPTSSRGWMIGAALIVAGSIVYVASPKHRPPPATAPTTTASPSIEPTPVAPPEALLAEYDAAIADGDLAHASEIAERLAVTAEKDPRVAVRRARVAVVKADRVWLASRLASPSAAPNAGDDLVSMLVARELTTLGEQASALSAAALAAAPDDTQAVLARIDALRIAGKLEDADALVPRVEAKRDDGDVAYTLGALELVERKSQVAGAPAGLTDIQHAAAAAPKLGRPQALLAFLLADSGDLDAAREAARGLESLGRPHPLVAPLRRFIASRSTTPPADSAQSAQQPSSSIEVPDTPKPVTPSTAPELVARGDAARAKGDRGAAQTFYARALALNPNSLQALLGRADVEWDTGMRARAAAHYKQIAERFPQAPPRVKDRLATE